MAFLRLTTTFAKKFLSVEKGLSLDELSEMVQNFYQSMNARFENQSQNQIDLLNDTMERVLNEHIYQVISARIINEDEEHNMAIQERIRRLHWVTSEHLEINIDFDNPIAHDLLDRAMCQMIEINSKQSSIDKLECIVRCSKTIFELLKTNGSPTPFSADHFLPVLVYVVLQANPPMLPADTKYITKFSNPRRLLSGETGYYFTNLCCAIEFIEKIDAASLNMSEDQFQRMMTNQSQPDTYLCDGLRSMCSNDGALKNLLRHSEKRLLKIDQLLESIDVQFKTNQAKLKEMQTFAPNLEQILKPSYPKFYMELKEHNPELANKLLPSFMKPKQAEVVEGKLIDI